jgi:hypothetical protein
MFIAFFAILLGVQLGISSLLTEVVIGANRYFQIGQGMLFVLTIGLFALIHFAASWDPSKMGFAFLVGSTVKMLVSLFFLFMVINGQVQDYLVVVYNFMMTYFAVLVFEVVLALRALKKQH